MIRPHFSTRTLQASVLGVVMVSSLVSQSDSKFFPVIVRTKSGHAKEMRRPLAEITSEVGFETDDFKVVRKKCETVLLFESDSEADSNDECRKAATPAERLEAATVLYHLQRAKSYFRQRLRSSEVARLEKMVVRLGIDNNFGSPGHFEVDGKDSHFNNATSVPAGPAHEDTAAWNREIWFRPRKDIPVQDLLAKLSEDPINPTIRKVNGEILSSQLDLGIRNFLTYAFSPSGLGNSLGSSLGRQAGTLVMIEGALLLSKGLNRLVMPQNYYIESALVPEIIYHEFAHVAMSDSLAITHSTAVIEGMADYFAAVISNNPTLAGKIKKYSTAKPKKGGKKQEYDSSFELRGNANADYVLSVLWGLRSSEVFGSRQADLLVFEARKHLNTRSSDIHVGLVNALVAACRTVCDDPQNDIYRLYQYFTDPKIKL